MRCPIVLFGIPIDSLSPQEALDRAFGLIDLHHDGLQPKYMATVNVDFIVNAFNAWTGGVRSSGLLEALRTSDIVVADGMPLIWLSRWLGSPIDTRLAGSTLVPLLATACAERGRSIFLLGGDPSTARRAAKNLQTTSPGLKIAGISTPQIDTAHPQPAVDDTILRELADAKPDILLIGLGNPKQELWFQRVRGRLQVPLSIGVGGTFKFLAGEVSRAPDWMQRLGLEWLYRLAQEPRLLGRRYLRDVIEFPLLSCSLLYEGMRLRFSDLAHLKSTSLPALVPKVLQGQNIALLQLPERLFQKECRDVVGLLADQPFVGLLVIDLTKTESIDPYGVGLLMHLCRCPSTQSYRCYGVSRSLMRQLSHFRAWDCLAPRHFTDLQAILEAS